MKGLKRAHLIIKGRVQGVFFRAYTRDVAVTNGVKGYVRNLYNGDVEAVFEGQINNIEAAIAMCYKGPPASHVDDIEIEWSEYTGEFGMFSVRY